jgi:hypothetical protein
VAKDDELREPGRPSAPSSTGRSTREGRGALDEVGEIFERATGEVARVSEQERAAAKGRGPVARVLLGLTIASVLLTATTMFYGIYKFPDAPIRQTAGGYVGKGGGARTREDFEAFNAWKTTLLFVVPSAFVFAFAFTIADARRRRKS